MSSDASKFFVGMLIGAIGGLVAGLLIAPDSGKVTRAKISDKTHKFKKELEDLAEAAKETISGTVDDYMKGHKPKSEASYKR